MEDENVLKTTRTWVRKDGTKVTKTYTYARDWSAAQKRRKAARIEKAKLTAEWDLAIDPDTASKRDLPKFLARIDRESVPGCWRWTAPSYQIHASGRPWTPARWAYAYFRNVKRDAGHSVVRSCDTVGCVNPKHLDLASSQEALDAQFKKLYQVDADTGCWVWTGTSGRKKNRPVFTDADHATVGARRWAYIRWVGLTERNLKALCKNSLCVNPEHVGVSGEVGVGALEYTEIESGCWEPPADRSQTSISIVRRKLFADQHQGKLAHQVRNACGNSRCVRPKHSMENTRLNSFLSKVDKQDNKCWLWTGGQMGGNDGSRYSSFNLSHGAGTTYGHRWSYEHFVGPIPDGLEIDHLCETKLCVNPEHLQPVTFEENMRRAGYFKKSDSACRLGHPYTPENIYWSTHKSGKKYRTCKECSKLANERVSKRRAEDPEYRKKLNAEARIRMQKRMERLRQDPAAHEKYRARARERYHKSKKVASGT